MERRLSSQSHSDSSSSYEDRRFAQLLKPIKDLTANWNVPLAEYLQNYYQEITLEVSLDGRTHKLNFAEAALFLQGTAHVYSKKVEYLWQEVLQMLDTLASKRALEEAAAAAGDGDKPSGRRSRKGPSYDAANFELIHLELAKGADINLKSDDGNGSRSKDLHSRKMTLRFIFVTPRQLIEKEGKEIKQNRIPLYDKNMDLIGHKDDFRINMQFSMATGMIGEELTHDSDLGMQSVSLCDDSEDVTATPRVSLVEPPQTAAAEPQTAETPPADDLEDILSPPPPPDDDFDPPDDDVTETAAAASTAVDPAAPEVIGERHEDESGQQSPNKMKRDRLAEVCEEPKAPLADPWEPITPQETDDRAPKKKRGSGGGQAKPIKRGKTTKLPPGVTFEKLKAGKMSRGERQLKKQQEQSLKSAHDKLRVTVPVEHFLIQELSHGKYLAKDLLLGQQGSYTPLEFKDLPKRGNKARTNKEEGEDAQKKPDNDNDVDSAHPEVDGGEMDEDDEEVPEMPEADPHDGDGDLDLFEGATDMPLTPPPVPAAHNTTTANDADSYEQLVIARVADYVARSHDYIESTDLAKRVAKWHESIGPRLDEVEKRGNFDIHSYGTKILDSLGPPEDSVSKSFSEVAQGEAPEEVARLFLSSLMLANTYNIDLKSASGLPLAMDDARMTLLSTQRHHENMFDSPVARAGPSRKFLDSSDDSEDEQPTKQAKKLKRALKPGQKR